MTSARAALSLTATILLAAAGCAVVAGCGGGSDTRTYGPGMGAEARSRSPEGGRGYREQPEAGQMMRQGEMGSQGMMQGPSGEAASPPSAGGGSGSAGGSSGSAGGSARGVAPKAITLIVKSDAEHGRRGPEGAYHDAFIPASFTVRAHQRVTVTVYNYDDSAHTFTDPGIAVNETILPGSQSRPGRTTFTFTAPTKPGSYEWFCDLPCDPFSMSHKGFMRGDVTVA